MWGPKTKEEAAAFKYGIGIHLPYDAGQFAAVVMNQFYGGVQCSRKPGHGPDALFCKHHAKRCEEDNR